VSTDSLAPADTRTLFLCCDFWYGMTVSSR
jgi:hypothetical protein